MRLVALAVAAVFFAGGCDDASVLTVRLQDLAGQAVMPMEDTDAKATVFIFVCTDCPIANRYAPEISRLAAKFEQQGVAFWLVYADRDESPELIEKHRSDYDHSIGVLRDPAHALVDLAKAKVTPEAFVFLPDGKLAYRGRIDNRYVDFGKARAAATQLDLQNALEASLAGKLVAEPVTTAIGCYIPDVK